MMDRLAKVGLYGAGLVEIDTPLLVQRYNSCLAQLGIAGTKLERFRIDGVGWSPEVAKEKEDDHYLSSGLLNQWMLILTPDQRRRPIYVPFSSYERRMIDAFFSRFEEEIADITTTNALILTVDHGLSELQNLGDLLHISRVLIHAAAEGDLSEITAEQKALVGRFINEARAWTDTSLRAQILNSARTHGDLRNRRLEIPKSEFTDLRSFYSEAFDGVFVIRTEPGRDDLLIVQNKELVGSGRKQPKNVLWLNDPRLPERLFMFREIFDLDLDWYAQNLQVLDQLMECLEGNLICSSDPAINFRKMTKGLRKRTLVGLERSKLQTYYELERLRNSLENRVHPDLDDLSPGVKLVLYHPSASLPDWYKDVVWQLLCRLSQHDPLRLYKADKNRFFQMYSEWPESKQVWVSETLARSYKPHRSTKE